MQSSEQLTPPGAERPKQEDGTLLLNDHQLDFRASKLMSVRAARAEVEAAMRRSANDEMTHVEQAPLPSLQELYQLGGKVIDLSTLSRQQEADILGCEVLNIRRAYGQNTFDLEADDDVTSHAALDEAA